MSAEESITRAVESFYAAVNQTLNGDAGPALDLWSHGPEVTVMHPAGGRQLGWEEVQEVWKMWAKSVRDGHIDPTQLAIRLLTPDVAYATCTERGQGSIGPDVGAVDARATLILRREGKDWKVVHHHVDVVPRLQEIVARAMASAAAQAGQTL